MPANKLSEPHVLIANQKKHINSLNRFIWMLINKAGGEVRMSHKDEMTLPEGWKFCIEPDPNNPDVIVFSTNTDAPKGEEKALTA